MTDKEKIKQEIERRIESMNSCPFKTAELYSEKLAEGELYAYKQILQFIDHLSEESGCEVNFTTKNEDLEEAASLYCHNLKNTGNGLYGYHITDAFKAGAEWQKEQDNVISRQAEAERIKTQQLCYEKGRFDMREEMMKDAVNAIFIQDYAYKTPVLYGDLKYKMNIVSGQPIKLYQIVKED